MTYCNTMIRLLKFDPIPVKRMNLKQLQYYCIINVIVLGLIYGGAAAFFSQIVLIENGFDSASFNGLKIMVAGIPVAFLMHAGASLFVWVFFSAIGGKSNFLLSYFHMGVAAVSLWPLAPFIAALQTGNRALIPICLTIIFSLYAFSVTVLLMRESFRLSRAKIVIATSITVLYIGCFLYLWV